MRGSVLEKEGGKNPSDLLMSSRTFRQHPSSFMTVAKKKEKKKLLQMFSALAQREDV